jgi:transglutaminase-like putative cysteine protease
MGNRRTLPTAVGLSLGLSIGFLLTVAPARAAAPAYHPIWDAPAFSADAAALREATAGLEADPGTPAVILFEEARYRFEPGGRLTYRFRKLYKVLNQDGATGFGSVEMPWSPWFEERPVIRARVLGADGKLHQLDPATLSVAAAPASGQIYSDRQVLRGPLPAMAPGAVVEIEIVNVDREPFFGEDYAYRFYFGASVPVRQSRVIVDAPASLSLEQRVHGLPALQQERRRSGDRTLWIFTHGPQEPFEDAPAYLPSDVSYYPYLAFSAGPSWAVLAARYHERLEARIRAGGVDALPFRPSARDRDTIVREALAFVHANIRYSGLEFGESSIIPWTPAETWSRKYGDCKDQATLLVALLRRAGVPAHVALLRAGHDEDVEPSQPTLRHFNHAIVYVPGARPIWIDPTDEYARAGELPLVDRGRRALIIAPGGQPSAKNLQRTPAAASIDNQHIETREIHLQPHGKARVVEITAATGSIEQGYRAGYRDARPEQVRKFLEEYMADEYMAHSFESYRLTEAGDKSVPFSLRIEAAGSERAQTFEDGAMVFVYPSDLFRRLPPALKTVPDEKEKPRVHDFALVEPYVHEQRYRIHLPPGFSADDLPEAERRTLGPALFTSEFRREGDVVHATLRFDTVRARFTPAEMLALQKGVAELTERGPITLRFDHEARALLSAGRTREAVDQMRDLVTRYPDRAIYRSQLAHVLLLAGMGEAARDEARQAVRLDEKSAHAHAALAWVLQHDALGRQHGPGFDLAGSIAAYRKARELDPRDPLARANLAITLEYDQQGGRYAGVDLDPAIAEYESRRKDLDARDLDANLLLAMFHDGRLAAARALGSSMEATRLRSAVMVAAAAAERGPDEALRQARQLLQDRDERRQALDAAVDLLVATRRYEQARALAVEAARGAGDAAARQNRIDALGRVRRVDVATLPLDRPESAVQRLLLMLLAPDARKPRPEDLFAKNLGDSVGAEVSAQMRAWFGLSPRQLQDGWSRDAMLDVVMGLAAFEVEAAPPWGWRVDMTMAGAAQTPSIYVVHERGAYRILAIAPVHRATLGRQALALAARGDLDGARKWLDWAREGLDAPDVEDALDGSAFVRLWNTSGVRDRERIELAAASLAALGEKPDRRVMALLQRCADSKTPERLACRGDLLRSHIEQKQYDRAEAEGHALAAALPDSESLFGLRVMALHQGQRWARLDELAGAWLAAHPDYRLAMRAHAWAAQGRGDMAGARRWYEKLTALPGPDVFDLNELAWVSLFQDPAAGQADDVALAAAERAVKQTARQDPAVLNTLAAVHAARGELHLAQQVMMETIARRDNAIDDADWLVYARIAQGYGLHEVARAAYARLSRDDEPGSAYLLSLRWRDAGHVAARSR